MSEQASSGSPTEINMAVGDMLALEANVYPEESTLPPVPRSSTRSRIFRKNNKAVGVWEIAVSPVFLVACSCLLVALIAVPGLVDRFAQPNRAFANERQDGRAHNASNNTNSNHSVADNSASATSQASGRNRDRGEDRIRSSSVEDSPAPLNPPATDTISRSQSAPSSSVAAPSPAIAAPVQAAEKNEGVSGGFTTQLGSFITIGQANERAEILRLAGIEVRVVAGEIPNRGTWFRVQSGSFNTPKEAQANGATLKARGIVTEFTVMRLTK